MGNLRIIFSLSEYRTTPRKVNKIREYLREVAENSKSIIVNLGPIDFICEKILDRVRSLVLYLF